MDSDIISLFESLEYRGKSLKKISRELGTPVSILIKKLGFCFAISRVSRKALKTCASCRKFPVVIKNVQPFLKPPSESRDTTPQSLAKKKFGFLGGPKKIFFWPPKSDQKFHRKKKFPKFWNFHFLKKFQKNDVFDFLKFFKKKINNFFHFFLRMGD